jgi:hypothetical protein
MSRRQAKARRSSCAADRTPVNRASGCAPASFPCRPPIHRAAYWGSEARSTSSTTMLKLAQAARKAGTPRRGSARPIWAPPGQDSSASRAMAAALVAAQSWWLTRRQRRAAKQARSCWMQRRCPMEQRPPGCWSMRQAGVGRETWNGLSCGRAASPTGLRERSRRAKRRLENRSAGQARVSLAANASASMPCMRRQCDPSQ